MTAEVAIGVRDHSGWAVLVALAGPPSEPVVVARRRMQLCPDDEPRQVYHAAEKLPVAEAAPLIARVEQAASALAAAELKAAVAGVGGHDVVAAALPIATQSIPDDLAAVLKSHMLLHAGEGALYREALLDGAEACGLRVVGVDPRTVVADLADRLGGDVPARLTALGKPLGPPWTKDHKEAAAAAWLALLG